MCGYLGEIVHLLVNVAYALVGIGYGIAKAKAEKPLRVVPHGDGFLKRHQGVALHHLFLYGVGYYAFVGCLMGYEAVEIDEFHGVGGESDARAHVGGELVDAYEVVVESVVIEVQVLARQLFEVDGPEDHLRDAMQAHGAHDSCSLQDAPGLEMRVALAGVCLLYHVEHFKGFAPVGMGYGIEEALASVDIGLA